ncbi:zinc finger protein 543-like [Artemia franciscana]|uniref:zinc finger protein 543-like n=1 Tax=Artemia franciscana TaxID=6661 RepID=UPI0032DA0905
MAKKNKELKKTVKLSNDKHSHIIENMMKELSDISTDVTVVCSDGQIQAHSFIIAQMSPVFCSALNGFPEGFQYYVTLPDLQLELVRSLISLLYTGTTVLDSQYVDHFKSLLEDLEIELDINTSEIIPHNKASGHLNLSLDEDNDDSELQSFIAPPPKRRNPIKIGSKPGRPRKIGTEPPRTDCIQHERAPSAVATEEVAYHCNDSKDLMNDDASVEMRNDAAIESTIDSRIIYIADDNYPKNKLSQKSELTDDEESPLDDFLVDEDDYGDGESGADQKKLRKRLKKDGLKTDKKDEGGRTYSCSICKTSYPSGKAIKEHYATHKKGGFYQCTVCSQQFRAFAVLAVHNRKHTGEKPFKCKFCQREFAHKASFDTHLNRHTGEKPYACKECGKGFHNRAALYSHVCPKPPLEGDPQGFRYECPECHRRFKSRVALGRHKTIHKDVILPPEKTVLCELCGKAFTSNYVLKKHLKYHSGEREFTCSTCGKGFIAESALRAHETCHDPLSLTHMCNLCPKGFRSLEILDKHIAKVHSAHREHVCQICTESYRLRSELENHMLIHSNQVKYWCECGKLFLSAKYLQKHKLTHIKRDRCQFCRKAFSTSEERDAHEEQHKNGALPITKNNYMAKSYKNIHFTCKDCGNTFNSTDSLTNHILKQHSAEGAQTESVMYTEQQVIDQKYYAEEVIPVTSEVSINQNQWPIQYLVIQDKVAYPTQVVLGPM